MQISNETLVILKNFASIEKKMEFNPGHTLRTRTGSVFVEAKVAEEFPDPKSVNRSEFGVYDISNLLNVLSLFDEPDIEFGETSLIITSANGTHEGRYGYAGQGSLGLLKFPKKMHPLPEEVIEFTLPEEQLVKLQKAVSYMEKPEMKVTSDGKVVKIGTGNHKNENSNSFSMVFDAEPNKLKCNMWVAKEHLIMMKGSYKGWITPTYIMLKNTSGYDLTYYVGVEPNSTFGK
jgi:hypothetical protein